MVSDGDSKAFNAVERTYGDNCKVIKLDCVGHVQKRMDKHLLNLKVRTKGKLADGKHIRGRGRLSDQKIKQIQRYHSTSPPVELISVQVMDFKYLDSSLLCK